MVFIVSKVSSFGCDSWLFFPNFHSISRSKFPSPKLYSAALGGEVPKLYYTTMEGDTRHWCHPPGHS